MKSKKCISQQTCEQPFTCRSYVSCGAAVSAQCRCATANLTRVFWHKRRRDFAWPLRRLGRFHLRFSRDWVIGRPRLDFRRSSALTSDDQTAVICADCRSSFGDDEAQSYRLIQILRVFASTALTSVSLRRRPAAMGAGVGDVYPLFGTAVLAFHRTVTWFRSPLNRLRVI